MRTLLCVLFGLWAGLSSAFTGTSQVAPGQYHTCAVSTDGALYCWGEDADGQLGDGTDGGPATATPQLVTGVTEAIDRIASNNRATCFLAISGNLYCWGDNGFGELGIGVFSDNEPLPTAVVGLGTPVRNVALGGGHACVVDIANQQACWGYNNVKQLGNETASGDQASPVPVLMPNGYLVKTYALGASHSCALDVLGRVLCWGSRGGGRLGDGATSGVRATPAPVLLPDDAGNLDGIADLASGAFHTCALGQGGDVRCWGNNSWGQLGADPVLVAAERFAAPVASFGIDNRQLALGQGFTCVLKVDGTVWCVGDDSYAQLGDGTVGVPAERFVPQPVTGLPGPASAIRAGLFHTCAIIAADQSLWCWGRDHQGQLGDGTVGVPDRQPYAGPVTGFTVRGELLVDGFE